MFYLKEFSNESLFRVVLDTLGEHDDFARMKTGNKAQSFYKTLERLVFSFMCSATLLVSGSFFDWVNGSRPTKVALGARIGIEMIEDIGHPNCWSQHTLRRFWNFHINNGIKPPRSTLKLIMFKPKFQKTA